MAQKTRSNSRRRATQKLAQSRKTDAGVMDRVERAQPSTLARYLRSARTDLHLRALEKQLQRNQRRCGRRLNGTVHQAERQVRRLSAEQDRRARQLKVRARREAVRVLKRLE